MVTVLTTVVRINNWKILRTFNKDREKKLYEASS
jgi:hypothetical protein